MRAPHLVRRSLGHLPLLQHGSGRRHGPRRVRPPEGFIELPTAMTPHQPEPIQPVSGSQSRPLWSVMIPSYNCSDYLRKTLASVLAEDPGANLMQIEVVDDCSTVGNPAQVVSEFGQGRVQFHRKLRNAGATANFNTCIARATGHLVHILHGDDYVRPEFYHRVGAAFEANPDVSFVATRSFVVDRLGELMSLSARYPGLERATRFAGELFSHNEIFTPSVVVRRSAYETHGGFRPDLVHTADWEMWLRIITLEGGVMLNEPLAGYRVHQSNDTNRLAQTAGNLRDYLRFGEYAAALSPSFSIKDWQRNVAILARRQSLNFLLGTPSNLPAARANAELWAELTPLHIRLLERFVSILSDRVQRWAR